MAWCQNCQTEFEDYVKMCSDCGQPLISAEAYTPRKISKEKSVYYEYNKLIQLTNCPNNIMADLLISMLESNDIHASVTYEGSGSYMNIIGVNSIYGVNVMVPEKDLEAAKVILRDFSYDNDYDKEEYESDELTQYNFKKKFMYAIMLIFCLVQISIIIISNISSFQ